MLEQMSGPSIQAQSSVPIAHDSKACASCTKTAPKARLQATTKPMKNFFVRDIVSLLVLVLTQGRSTDHVRSTVEWPPAYTQHRLLFASLQPVLGVNAD